MTIFYNYRPRWLLSISTWRDRQRRLIRLGSAREGEREAAIDWFVAQGAHASPVLRHGLRGPVAVACGAATALYRQGEAHGIRTVLRRCYEEDWLRRCVQDGHPAELSALRRLGRSTVGAVLMAALDDAVREKEGRACLDELTVGLSALKVAAVFGDVSPKGWWERAALFGPTSLRGLGDVSVRPLAYNLTASIRMEAINRLLCEHRSVCVDVLIDALQSEDRQVALTAIDGLQKLKDRRSLPYLYVIAFGSGNALASRARRAIERIAGNQADALILLRAAREPRAHEVLLRPAIALSGPQDNDALLRAVM